MPKKSIDRVKKQKKLATVAETHEKAPKPEVFISEQNFDQPGDTKKKPRKKLSKKAKIIIACSVVAVLLAGSAAAYMLTRPKKVERAAVQTKAAPPAKTTVPSPLTGVEVSPQLAKRPPVTVVIENLYPNARPQSGLSSAGVVYEALAEGGITRYLAVFQDGLPLEKDIGPVRSLRTYFVDWTLEYNAPVVHAGGNVDAIALIKPTGLKSLNQFYNGNYFRRISSRPAPHNLYTTGKQLDQLLKDRGYDGEPTFTPWPRKDDDTNRPGDAVNITVDFSARDYQASFAYDADSKLYKRSLRGTADIDADTNQQISPKNVVVISMPTHQNTTRENDLSLVMQTVGSGQAWVFTDGSVTVGRWQKDSRTDRIKFNDSTGAEIKLNRGQTWISVIPTDKTVNYQ